MAGSPFCGGDVPVGGGAGTLLNSGLVGSLWRRAGLQTSSRWTCGAATCYGITALADLKVL